MSDYPDPNTINHADDDDIEAELALPDDTGRERTTARWLSLQILYEIDSAHHPSGEVMARHLNRYSLQRLTLEYTYQLVNGVLENLEKLDEVIQRAATEWPLDQIAIVDRNLLRLAVCEYVLIATQSVGVVTKEAVKLAEVFGGDTSPRFVNGVLGALFEDPANYAHLLTPDSAE